MFLFAVFDRVASKFDNGEIFQVPDLLDRGAGLGRHRSNRQQREPDRGSNMRHSPSGLHGVARRRQSITQWSSHVAPPSVDRALSQCAESWRISDQLRRERTGVPSASVQSA